MTVRRILLCLGVVGLAIPALWIHLYAPLTTVYATYGFSYMLAVCALLPFYLVVPPRHRQFFLVAVSLSFSFVVMSSNLTLALLLNVAVLYLLTNAGRAGLVLFPLWTVGFFAIVPWSVVHLQREFKIDVVEFEIIQEMLLYSTFKRGIVVFWEAKAGAVQRVELRSLLLYMMGLPFLGPHGVEPSYRHFIESYTCRDDDLDLALWQGIKTSAYCMLALLLADLLPDLTRAILTHATPYAITVAFSLQTFIAVYFHRLSGEQGSVGVSRMFGYQLRDNFAPRVLLSKSPAEFWRGWNALWREFLLFAFFYPVTLRLGRRPAPPPGASPWARLWKYRMRVRWAVALGGFLTFAAAGIFDVAFMLLAHLHTMSPMLASIMAREMVAQLVWGAIVSVNLYVAAARPKKQRSSPMSAPFRVAATLLIVVSLILYRRRPHLVTQLMGW